MTTRAVPSNIQPCESAIWSLMRRLDSGWYSPGCAKTVTSRRFVIMDTTFRMPQANSESRRFHAALDRTLRPLRVAKALHRNPTPLRSLTRHHAHCHIGFRWSQADCPILMRFAADRELLGVSCAVSHARSGHEALRSSPLPGRLARNSD